jgi:hypothetical protein
VGVFAHAAARIGDADDLEQAQGLKLRGAPGQA